MWVNTKLEQLRTYFSANEPKKCSIELKSKISPFCTFTLIQVKIFSEIEQKKMFNWTKI